MIKRLIGSKLGLGTAVLVAGGLAVPATGSATQLLNFSCPNVGPHSFCLYSPFAASPGNEYARFSLNNGAGVLHEAVIYQTPGTETTAQDAYSPCTYINTNNGDGASGLNDSASAHSYTLSAFTC